MHNKFTKCKMRKCFPKDCVNPQKTRKERINQLRFTMQKYSFGFSILFGFKMIVYVCYVWSKIVRTHSIFNTVQNDHKIQKIFRTRNTEKFLQEIQPL